MVITDFEKNGRCSGCGQCCCDTMIVTSEEVRRIAQYAQTHSFHWTFLGNPIICKVMGMPLTDRAKLLGCDPSTLRIKEVRK